MFAGICWGDTERSKPLTHTRLNVVIPAHAGTHDVALPEHRKSWLRVFAGMTSGRWRNHTPGRSGGVGALVPLPLAALRATLCVQSVGQRGSFHKASGS
jgi:hypothetical protein